MIREDLGFASRQARKSCSSNKGSPKAGLDKFYESSIRLRPSSRIIGTTAACGERPRHEKKGQVTDTVTDRTANGDPESSRMHIVGSIMGVPELNDSTTQRKKYVGEVSQGKIAH